MTAFRRFLFGSLISFALGCQNRVPHVDLVSVASNSAPGVHPSWDRSSGAASAGRGVIRAWGAVNETLDFRFAVVVGPVGLENPELRIATLRSSNSRIESTAATFYRMHPVPVERFPGWHIRSVAREDRDSAPLDCLVPVGAPRGGLPSRLSAETRFDFWVDLEIPKGTFEGVYSAEVELLSAGRKIAGLPVELTVKPIVLPDGAEIPMIAPLDHRALFRHHLRRDGRTFELASDDWRGDPQRNEIDGLLRASLRLLERHRLTPVLPGLTPPTRITAQQDVVIDWGQYDEIAEPCLSGRLFPDRIPLSAWPMPAPPMLTARRGSESRAAEQVRRRFLVACAEHFRGREWLRQAYLPAGPLHASAFAADAHIKELGDLLHELASDVRLMTSAFPQDMRPVGWMGGAGPNASRATIWAPRGQFFDREEMAQRRPSGEEAWLVVDRPPFTGSASIFGSATDARVLSWQAEREGAAAVVLSEVNRWPGVDGSPDPKDCAAADPNVLLYPGGAFGLAEPVETVRLKRLRRTQQDADYRRLLSDKALGHVRETLMQALAPYAGTAAIRSHFADGKPNAWPTDDAWFELAREIMAEEIVRTGATVRENVDPPFARTAAWRRFMLDLRTPRLWIDGCRVRERSSETLLVDGSATIQNGSRVPISGKLRAVSASDGDAILGSLSPDASRTIVYSFSLSKSSMASGVSTVPFELTLADGGRLLAEARVAWVEACWDRTAPKIDGDLRDWAPMAGSDASDFQLITFTTETRNRAFGRSPSRRTTAFLRRDAEFLYVAVNAAWTGQTRSSSKGNTVIYEDLVPVGEELVEILVDPLNAGTRSPGDLFHIAVKPSGAVLTEKGIRFDPPCGPRQPWNADVLAATRETPDRWTAELRIPLASFGADALESSIWGLNVTRFDLENQEFSTWSGSLGNAYDPLSMGSLYLTPAGEE